MAEGDKTFTVDEHTAILADRVATETAALTTELETVKASEAELQTKLDVAESARVAAEQAAEQAKTELEEFKTQLEADREAASRKDERLGKVKEVAAHLGEDFFADEKRVERIVAMDQEAFDGYVEDLKATAPEGGAATVVAPRQTAMTGESVVTQPSGAGSAAKTVLLGRFGGAQTQEG
jgi:chromosome segregation ATPase